MGNTIREMDNERRLKLINRVRLDYSKHIVVQKAKHDLDK